MWRERANSPEPFPSVGADSILRYRSKLKNSRTCTYHHRFGCLNYQTHRHVVSKLTCRHSLGNGQVLPAARIVPFAYAAIESASHQTAVPSSTLMRPHSATWYQRRRLLIRRRALCIFDMVREHLGEVSTKTMPKQHLKSAGARLILVVFTVCSMVTNSQPERAVAQGSPMRVDARNENGTFVLDNGIVSARFDAKSGTLSAQADAVTFLRSGRLSGAGGTASFTTISDSLGTGKAIEVVHPNGSADLVALYPGVPFVCIKPRIHNGESERTVIDTINPASLAIDLGRTPADLRVLGCDGLTPAGDDRHSYTFLAVADPATRAGAVAGWLTHHRGSGIVLSGPDGSDVRIDARCEYGKLLIEPHTTAEGELFAIGYFDDALLGLEAYADAIAKANAVKLRPTTCGYCTWYHAGALNEKSMARLAEFCGDNLAKFGFEVIQIDDRWQVSNRDFTSHKPDGPYPSGMKSTADTIRAAGMTAGLWFIPFGWDHQRPVFENHQDWFVRRDAGEVYSVEWAGDCLDTTHPEARDFLRDVVARITKDWGYKYIKIDGLWSGMAVKALYPEPAYRNDGLGDARFHNPHKTNIEAYRDGLELVREAAGADVFILGCNIAQNMRTLGASFGLVDGMRVGRDIGADWDTIRPCAQMGSRLYFLHNRVWYNDPDCLMLRKPLTLDQARVWGSWIAISGQLNLVSEWLPGLPPEKLDVVKRSMPNHGLCARPIDLFENDLPEIWHLSAGSDEKRRDILALFNWDAEKGRTLNVDLDKVDLPRNCAGPYVGFDYWADEFVPPFNRTLKVGLPPSSCRVIAIRPVLDRPQLVSTSRHISQGVVDVLEENWSGKALSGTSLVVGNDPYELRIVTPTDRNTWKAVSAGVSDEDEKAGVTIMIGQSDREIRATIVSPSNRRCTWAVVFNQS
jgi:hypothetical protein